MKDFPGTPGTLTGLLLRISQCVFAAGSIASMATTTSFFNFTAFWKESEHFPLAQVSDSVKIRRHLFSCLFSPYDTTAYKILYCIIDKSLDVNDASVSVKLILVAVKVSSQYAYKHKLGYIPYPIYLTASMGLQLIWSFVLALLDAYALLRKKVFHNPVLVSLFVVGDWVTATLSLAAASASAGITVLYFSDLGHCNFGEECQKYQMSVCLAYLSWVTIAISSLIMLWLLAAG
ncbi:hypothetical protein TIFTF001_022590 [Ficus carica]|uniref:CASP-like protein n=1 Tax=Ficus carica TaxID=3494 RepID=A0AA88ACV0_FICCA|nr:hypothetical protein TIFTF001_022590 [Ficus carica]